MKYLILIYAAVCLAVFLLYGIDKQKAIHHRWRIPESVLLIAAVFGAPGALLGMIFFHHKTRKAKFFILVPLILLLEFGTAIFVYVRFLSPGRTYSDAYFGITAYHSSVDADGDGIDDQTDFLQSVRKYIATKPRYKSRYYSGGYPDDGYGVCTDVVGFGMKGAGYDLMELVDADIKAHPDWYDVDKPDKNIDFRRVSNLKVYFSHHAISLTTDTSQTEEWQGGDIVIFKNHIGVVSDRRNKDGVPCLIHHYGPYQINYEENVLEDRGDITGHYRIS